MLKFFKRIEELQQRQAEAIADIGRVLAGICDSFAGTPDALAGLEQQLTQARQSVSDIKKRLDKTPLAIYAAKKTYEAFLREKFLGELATLDLRKDYRKLLRGLDDESIQVVASVLARVRALHDATSADIDLFSEQEQSQIKYLRRNFWQQIIQIDEGCFAYRDYLLPIKHFEPSVFFYEHEMNHLTTLDRMSDKAIIDIGAFIGDSALLFVKKFAGAVHSFEPTKENYQLMLQTIDLNKTTRIVPVNKGIAESARTAELYVDGSVSGEHAGQFIKETSETGKMITLDEYVAANNLEVGLIKVDTEGGEPDVLRGAERTIKTQRPALILSIYHSAYDFFHIKPLIESWDLGYTLKIRRPTDGQIMSETVLLAEVE